MISVLVSQLGVDKQYYPATSGVITVEAEATAYDFTVGDFTFTLGEEGTILFSSIQTMEYGKDGYTRIYDLSRGKYIFRGYITAEGTDYDEETGLYQFRAVHISKHYADLWREQASTIVQFKKMVANANPQFGIDVYPKNYMRWLANYNVDMAVELPEEYTVTEPTLNTIDTRPKVASYSVFQLLIDIARYTNSIMMIDDNSENLTAGQLYVRFQSRLKNRKHVTIDKSSVFRFRKKLREPQFLHVAYKTDTGKTMIHGSGLHYTINDGDAIPNPRTLDLTSLNKKISEIPNSAFNSPLDALFPTRSESELNMWDKLFKVRCDYEIGVSSLVDIDIMDGIVFDGLPVLDAIKIEYDIINETTVVIGTV